MQWTKYNHPKKKRYYIPKDKAERLKEQYIDTIVKCGDDEKAKDLAWKTYQVMREV